MKFNTINEAIESIDFEAVSAAMRVLNWKVVLDQNGVQFGFPTGAELRSSLTSLYNTITLCPDPIDPEHMEGSIKSGPWHITKSKYSDSEMIGVSFSITKSILLVKE